MKKVLITGATGFIASHLVERNLKEGSQVRIFALPDDHKARERYNHPIIMGFLQKLILLMFHKLA